MRRLIIIAVCLLGTLAGYGQLNTIGSGTVSAIVKSYLSKKDTIRCTFIIADTSNMQVKVIEGYETRDAQYRESLGSTRMPDGMGVYANAIIYWDWVYTNQKQFDLSFTPLKTGLIIKTIPK